MKNIEIFEPAMCCSTGLCGVSVDPELLRISTVLNTLKERGIEVKRYNLTNAPMQFVTNHVVSEFVKLYGADKLPVIPENIMRSLRQLLSQKRTSILGVLVL